MAQPRFYEGTWDEITEQIRSEFSDKQRFKVIVMSEEQVDKQHFYFTATQEEFDRALDEIAEMNRGLPVLPDEAFDRENLYEEIF